MLWEFAHTTPPTPESMNRAEGGMEADRILSRLHDQRRAGCRAQSHNPVATWATVKGRMLNHLSCPGAPGIFFLFLIFLVKKEWSLKVVN